MDSGHSVSPPDRIDFSCAVEHQQNRPPRNKQDLPKEGILIRGATPIVPIVVAKQWRHQVVAMLDLRPGGSEGSPAMCVHTVIRYAAWTGGRDCTPQMDSDVYFVYLVKSLVKYKTSTVKQKATYEEYLKLEGSTNDNLYLESQIRTKSRKAQLGHQHCN